MKLAPVNGVNVCEVVFVPEADILVTFILTFEQFIR